MNHLRCTSRVNKCKFAIRLVTAQGVKEDHNNLFTTSNRYFLAYLKALSLGLIKHRTSKSAGPSGHAV